MAISVVQKITVDKLFYGAQFWHESYKEPIARAANTPHDHWPQNILVEANPLNPYPLIQTPYTISTFYYASALS